MAAGCGFVFSQWRRGQRGTAADVAILYFSIIALQRENARAVLRRIESLAALDSPERVIIAGDRKKAELCKAKIPKILLKIANYVDDTVLTKFWRLQGCTHSNTWRHFSSGSSKLISHPAELLRTYIGAMCSYIIYIY